MRRLLLVEHNPLFADGLALLVEWRTGLSSVRAGSLAEARAILEEAEQIPACVVVDLDLPEGEGTAVLEELDGVPVVALIGGRNLKRQAEAMELGAEEVLIKTEAAEKIASAVQRLMGPRYISGLWALFIGVPGREEESMNRTTEEASEDSRDRGTNIWGW
jgi:DNA-binding NarL/FixJ family response regulator